MLLSFLFSSSGDARYKYKHAVLGGTQLWKGEQPVVRDRRISVLFRPKLVPASGPGGGRYGNA